MTTLKPLNSQMHDYNVETHGWFKVSPNVRKIFGLVFASYIGEKKILKKRKIFIKEF